MGCVTMGIRESGSKRDAMEFREFRCSELPLDRGSAL